jgi:signal transduction histidine kinase
VQRQAVLLSASDVDAIIDSDETQAEAAPSGGAMVLPLIASGSLIGLLAVRATPGKTAYSPAEIELAQTVAGLLAGAIDNARLFRQSLAASVEAERRRLARELHDSVTQSLYSLNLLAAGWGTLIARGRAGDVQSWFGQVEAIALQALKEMRLLIHQLRPPELDQLGFVGALRERLDAVEGRAQMRTRLSTIGLVDAIDPLHTPQLFGAAQEALNNVLRHSGATEITVEVQVEAEQVQVTISDNGCGFDPGAHSAGIGLQTMRERIEQIGGTLTLSSTPGSGTTIVLRAPALSASAAQSRVQARPGKRGSA